ncbi:unnamed protein product, partial [Tetraodon nigroviridis]
SCGRRMRLPTTRPPPSQSSTTTHSSWCWSSWPPSSCSRTSTPPCILPELHPVHQRLLRTHRSAVHRLQMKTGGFRLLRLRRRWALLHGGGLKHHISPSWDSR